MTSGKNISSLGINLIGLHGFAGSGKDTVAEYLQREYQNVWVESFASPLKKACSAAFGIPLENFEDRKLKEATNKFWNISPRKIAQFVGTELFRYSMAPIIEAGTEDFWVRRMEGRILGDLCIPEQDGEYETGDTIVISDVRFQNEYDWIVANGGCMIHIVRPGVNGSVGIPGHKSEGTIIRNAPEITFTLDNNGTIEELFTKTDSIMTLITSHQERLKQNLIDTL